MPSPSNDSLGAPTRVLLIAGNAIVGGMEMAVTRLVERLPRSAFSIIALCPFESPFTSGLRDLGALVHVAPMGEKLAWHTVQHAVALAGEHDIQVIHAHMPAAHAVGGLAGRITRTPVLATIHSMHLSMWDLEVHRLAGTHLCVVSEASRAHALAVGVAPAHLSVIRNGVDAETFVPRAGARTGDGLTLGFVGRLSPEKNPALFLRTAALVRAYAPSARFLVIGEGPLRSELELLARTLRIADALVFAGECTDMPRRYHELDVLLSTSWHEGTPLAVLEAMASGLPVIATDVGGIPELVVSGSTGWLTPAGDESAMAEGAIALLRDAVLRERFGAAARTRALRQFSLTSHVEHTAALLTETAHRTGKGRGTAVRPLVAADRRDLQAKA
jgi:glycosyltransferase involved in cell wall biosynthesis